MTKLPPIAEPPAFVHRHLGPDSDEVRVMLDRIGFESVDALVDKIVPDDIRVSEPVVTAPALSEEEAQAKLRGYASQNKVAKAFYGQGFYATYTPPVIRRHLVENAGWYTAYTPYQPEISQGRLEALMVFQTMIQSLTGLPAANASLLDEASAVIEAVMLMRRASRKGAKVLLDSRLNPQDLSVATKRAEVLGIDYDVVDLTEDLVADDIFGVVVAYPGTEGDVADLQRLADEVHTRGGLVTVVADLLSLLLLKSPGSLGADISVGTSQRFGVPLFFGGPHAGYMAVTDKLVRKMPGRIVGVSIDAEGYPAYRLTLQTREQHIRREKATSNICTAQALLANTAAMYAVYHGADGLNRIATRIHELATSFAATVSAVDGVELVHESFFDTVTVRVADAASVVQKLDDDGYLVRQIGEDKVSVAFGEPATEDDVAALAAAFGATEVKEGVSALPADLLREDAPLQHEIFHTIHSETQMMRYLRRLQDRDLALDRTMIPLGSCTMKLNPAAAMEPITWPEFANVHPYAPESHTAGWRALIDELASWLTTVTGYDAVSVQPNAGAQGELAGLLAIRGYHLSRGDKERDIVLIPASAHGTNAASTAQANMRVVTVASTADGSIDLEDLDRQLEKHGPKVAAIMITYPSTHGVFEDTVRQASEKVHAVGGQVYIDGANMNALSGVGQPGQFGGDVSHLNLHKTFAIPHGGGGPGVGPIGVGAHLIPFLPGDPNDPEAEGIPVDSTRYGSAGVLPITWSYIAMLGGEGLAQATAHAILNANYLAHELNDSFPVLYTDENGLSGHECILDLRELTDKSGVTAADVAKRLVDYGFHAPTLAFPVAGTLMVEPTESEDLGELDRFITAMKTIRAEIQEIIDGKISHDDSVIANAPYTSTSVAADEWNYKFSRSQAAYPVASLRKDKYFPPVRRINEAYGDRHLQLTFPPFEAFEPTAD